MWDNLYPVAPPVKNWRILLEQSFTAHMPLLMAAIRLREKFSSVVLPALSLYHLDLSCLTHTHTHTTILRPFFRDHPGEPVPDENFWTSWWKGRLTETDTQTIRLGATPSWLTSVHLHYPPFFSGRMPFLPPSQQSQSTEGNLRIRIREKTLEFSSTVLPAPSP